MVYLPTRMCVACRAKKRKQELVKIVKLDKEYKICSSHVEGCRGIYLCKDVNCFNLACKKKVFNRVFKTEVDASFYDKLKEYFSEQN